LNRNIIILLVVVIAIGVGVYVLKVATTSTELDDISPLDVSPPLPTVGDDAIQNDIKDSLDSMDESTREQFEEEVSAMKDEVMIKADLMPTGPTVLGEGDFMRRFHSVEGKAIVIDTGSAQILRFEDFLTDNGPNLHIYLSSDLGADDFVDLGKIRATKGNVNYEIPKGTDLTKYDKVLVWCVPFGVLFSYADLQ
jgi:hypothetical protein